MTDHKKRIVDAMAGYIKKNDPRRKKKERKKKNDSPEGKFVLELKKYLEARDWGIDVVESAAVYSESAGRYLSGKARSGFSDMVGNTPDGHSAFIECKAPGKRGTIRPDQREFLIEKIASNCFAICADSIEYVERTFREWSASENRKAYLLKELPDLSPRWKKLTQGDLSFD